MIFCSTGRALIHFDAEDKVIRVGNCYLAIVNISYNTTLNNFETLKIWQLAVKWLGEGISQRVIPDSSSVSRHWGYLFRKMFISHNPYARSALNER